MDESHRARNPGKQLNKSKAEKVSKALFSNQHKIQLHFYRAGPCMFCKIFSDDQEIATNPKIGLCDYMRTERLVLKLYTQQAVCKIGQLGSRFRNHAFSKVPNLPQCTCQFGMHAVFWIPCVEPQCKSGCWIDVNHDSDVS